MTNDYLKFPEGNQCGQLFNQLINGTLTLAKCLLIGTELPVSNGHKFKLSSGDTFKIDLSSSYKKMTYSTANRVLINEMAHYISQNMQENSLGLLSMKQFGCTYKGVFIICILGQNSMNTMDISIEFNA